MKDYKTIPQLLAFVRREYENPTALNDKIGDKWEHLSTKKFYESVKSISLGLRSLGVKKNDTVGLVSNSNSLWLEVDCAIMTIGAITIPMFPNSADNNLDYIVKDAKVKFIFLGAIEKFAYFNTRCYDFEKIIIDNSINGKTSKFIKIKELQKLGKQQDIESPDLFGKLIKKTDENDIATIVYTSGSTGIPKGVMLTHKNLISQLKSIREIIPIYQTDITVSFLPMAHIFERIIAFIYLSSGCSVYFTPDIKIVGEIVKEVQPTIMTAVPRFLEKVYNKMKMKLKTSSPIKRFIGQLAFKRALTKESGDKPQFFDNIYETKVYTKLNDALGGNLRMLITGGSALSHTTYTFFTNIGIPIFQGYGLTEFSPVISTNYEAFSKVDTVGKPIPGVEVKISEAGEILAKGDSVMKGYLNKPDETAKFIDREGYLHTGDRGSLDKQGFLKIEGRIKELYKSSTGEYISPVPIEAQICKHELIDMAVVIAEDRKFASCLIFPDFDNIDYLKKKRGMSRLSNYDFVQSKKIRNEIKRYLNRVNKKLNHWEQIHKFRIIEVPLSIENNELTPKMSLRREEIVKNYSEVIYDIYGDSKM